MKILIRPPIEHPTDTEKLKRVVGLLHDYWVDFECWNITAHSEEEAEKIAMDRLHKGDYPDICNIERHDD